MTMHPVHYAPHHTGHLPLCGAEPDRVANGGLVLCTMARDLTTCFRCIDQYEERSMTPEQVAALTGVRDEINSIFTELEERAAFSVTKTARLDTLAHMLVHAPWWAWRLRFRLNRAMKDIRDITFEDVRGGSHA